MATTLPANTTKVNFDAGTDDPKQARAEFATNADIQNTLKSALGDFAQLSNPADSGLEVVAQGGGTPDDIRAFHTHERKTATYTAVAADRSKLLEMDSASALTLNLTAAVTLGEGWFILVNNSGVGTLTIDPNGAELIDDAATISLSQNQSTTIVCDGAAFWTVGTVSASGGLVLLATASASASSSVDFASFIDSTYDHYEIRLTNVVPATNAQDLWLRISVSAAFKSGVSDYAYTTSERRTDAAASNDDDGTAAQMVLTFTALGNAAAEGLSGVVRFAGPTSTTRRCNFTWALALLDNVTIFGRVIGAGEYRVTADVVDGVRFLMASGNITSGEFALYGVAKS